MPCIADRYLIPKNLKKTTKYSDKDREQVRHLFKHGMSIHSISKTVGMSKRMVQFVLFPERAERAKELFAKNQKDGRYRYPTEIQSAMVQKVRQRKKNILDKLIKKI